MTIRTKNLTTKGLPGNPITDLVVSAAEHDGQFRVIVHVRQHDTLGLPQITAVHSLTVQDAEGLIARLTAAIATQVPLP